MPTRSRPLTLVIGAALASAALLGGCGGGDDKKSTTGAAGTTPAAPPTATATTPTTTTPEASGGIDPMAGASTKPVVVRATNKQTALLTDVRAARQEGYDRVVFQFRNAVPGYDVRYVARPVHQDGSGNVVPVQGQYVAQIRMENALDADLTKASAPLTYHGPMRFSPGTPEVAELVRSGSFEGVLTWVAGLRDRVDFRVRAFNAPPRVVVDFRNH